MLILLILFSDFYRFQAISTKDAIISSGELYVFTFYLSYSIFSLMHLLTIVLLQVLILTYRFQAISTRNAIISSGELYVFTFYLSYSIFSLMHLLTIVLLQVFDTDFYRFQAIFLQEGLCIHLLN